MSRTFYTYKCIYSTISIYAFDVTEDLGIEYMSLDMRRKGMRDEVCYSDGKLSKSELLLHLGHL